MTGRFFQAEDGIRDVERSRGLGDVYKRQVQRKVMLERICKYVNIVVSPTYISFHINGVYNISKKKNDLKL